MLKMWFVRKLYALYLILLSNQRRSLGGGTEGARPLPLGGCGGPHVPKARRSLFPLRPKTGFRAQKYTQFHSQQGPPGAS